MLGASGRLPWPSLVSATIRAVIYFTLLLQFIFQLRTIAKQQLQNNETNLVGLVKLDYLLSTLQISRLRSVVASKSD